MEISREEAVVIARKEAETRGWPWLEPIHVSAKGTDWIVHSNYDARGANAIITVNGKSGEVPAAKFLPR
jgi:hypothetical protein